MSRLLRLPLLILTLLASGLPAAAQVVAPPDAPAAASQAPAAAKRRVTLEAQTTATGVPVATGVVWRIFASKPREDGRLSMLSIAGGGTKSFDMSPGEYLIHAAYGYAGAVRRVVVDAGEGEIREIFDFEAGALQLDAVSGENMPVPPALLRFDVYAEKADERGVRQLIARALRPDEIVPFPAGTYHVVSQYGRLNAEVRADLRVKPGKVTRAVLQHRAAKLGFRLTERAGGDALADTAWSVLTESGDLVVESASPFPTFVLTEGAYTVVARNREKTHTREFAVEAGRNQEIELVAQ